VHRSNGPRKLERPRSSRRVGRLGWIIVWTAITAVVLPVRSRSPRAALEPRGRTSFRWKTMATQATTLNSRPDAPKKKRGRTASTPRSPPGASFSSPGDPSWLALSLQQQHDTRSNRQ
jgi:hypothetical protein